ncbi:TetR/AcrR family transcriptional regulator [Demequina sp.]|uniref:TetR/AcrR family transcriptional regulator n=1 Tax=Demequina sp. TaxID=2050685 RepID=UPI0025E2C0C4|nr:TetR/AcrR family transcriptional regulator [Demequina sp.]
MPKVIDTDALFEATVRIFAVRGYAESTTQEIASRAGVNEVTLFRKYGTKAGLIGAALNAKLGDSPFAHVEASGDVRADLGAVAAAFDATNRAYGGAVMTLLVELPRHPELADAATILMANLGHAAEIMRTHQQAGRIAPGDPFQKVALLIAPLVAGGLWTRAFGELPGGGMDADVAVESFMGGHAGA